MDRDNKNILLLLRILVGSSVLCHIAYNWVYIAHHVEMKRKGKGFGHGFADLTSSVFT